MTPSALQISPNIKVRREHTDSSNQTVSRRRRRIRISNTLPSIKIALVGDNRIMYIFFIIYRMLDIVLWLVFYFCTGTSGATNWSFLPHYLLPCVKMNYFRFSNFSWTRLAKSRKIFILLFCVLFTYNFKSKISSTLELQLFLFLFINPNTYESSKKETFTLPALRNLDE